MDFDKLQFDHTEGSISLPPGRTSVHLVSTAAQGVDDLRTWNSFFMVSESRQGEQSVYGARMGTYIAGQRKNGEWELIGRFENLLDESPQERIMRLIRERCESDDAWNDELRSEIAAEEVLSLTWINNPREFGDFANEAIEALFRAGVKKNVSPSDNIEGFKKLSEFGLAKKALVIYFKGDEDIEEVIKRVVFRRGTGFFAYDLGYDPIEELKVKHGYKQMMEISPSDIDRFGGNLDMPQLENRNE